MAFLDIFCIIFSRQKLSIKLLVWTELDRLTQKILVFRTHSRWQISNLMLWIVDVSSNLKYIQFRSLVLEIKVFCNIIAYWFWQKSEKKVKGKTLRQYDNPVKPDTLPSCPFSASTPGSQDRLTQDKAIYKVVVKTGNQHNCGTDAEVRTIPRQVWTTPQSILWRFKACLSVHLHRGAGLLTHILQLFYLEWWCDVLSSSMKFDALTRAEVSSHLWLLKTSIVICTTPFRVNWYC